MNKIEFLDILRQTLDGEVNRDTIEQNIRYYDQYISSGSGKSEEEVLKELGDPRLIAKTIIDTEKISKQKNRYTGSDYAKDEFFNNEQGESNYNTNDRDDPRNTIFFTSLKWYHKILIAVLLVLLLLLLIGIGRFIIRILAAFAVPIIIILFIYTLFRRR